MPHSASKPKTAFAESLWLAAHPWPPRKQKMYDPLDVISTLNNAKVRFVLVGAHGLAEWVDDPRQTQDVDFVVMNKHQKRAAEAVHRAYPELEMEEHEVVVRFRNPETKKVVIDLIKQQALYREVFKHAVERTHGKTRFLIPCVELAIAMKFAAMLSPNRQDEDKFQDAHDFMRVIKSNPNLDEAKLAHLGDLVFPGGGKRLLALVADVRAGRKLVL